MSSLSELIARGRRASAGRRLGPPATDPHTRNGAGPRTADRNGRAGVSAVDVDAPQAPAPAPAPASEGTPSRPGFLARNRLRRRMRYLRRLRELQLRDLGGFALELRRLGERRPELVRSKIESAMQTDRELRGIERVLFGRVPLRELREAGIGGACPDCGTVYGSADHFCAACGRPLTGAARR